MSLLEKLPTELLERVFLYCLNLELPKSSPVISGKLSSQKMYNETIMAAFGPTWERWHGRQRSRLLKSDDAGPGDPGQDPILQVMKSYLYLFLFSSMLMKVQSAILRCRWTSLPILLKAKDIWIEKYAQDRPFKPQCKPLIS